jgi:hypothetical protein
VGVREFAAEGEKDFSPQRLKEIQREVVRNRGMENPMCYFTSTA